MLRVRAVLDGWSGGPGLSTFYFLTPLEDAAAALRCVGYVRNAAFTHWKGIWPLVVSFQVSGDVDVLSSASGQVTNTLSVATPGVVFGTVAGGQEAPHTALNLRLTTGTFIAGRRVRGRIFFSPLGLGVSEPNGTPLATSLAAVQAGADTLLTGLAVGDQWAVWHRPVAQVGGVAAPVSAASVPDKFAVLKSRRD